MKKVRKAHVFMYRSAAVHTVASPIRCLRQLIPLGATLYVLDNRLPVHYTTEDITGEKQVSLKQHHNSHSAE